MYDVLLAFGDSITQCAGDPEFEGYLAYLSRLYQRQMDVLNRGFSGYNTTRARTVVSKHTPIEKFRDNLLYFVSLLRDPSSKHYSPSTKILFITPPPVGDRMVKEKAKIEGENVVNKNERARKYAQMVKRVANEVNTPYVDLYGKIEELVKKNQSTAKDTQTVDFEGYDGYLADGIHLNSAGNRVLFDLIQETIGKYWPELKPSKAPRSYMPTSKD
ncbi:isoamyl acetate-hydrolyzing esterase [Coemansia sp. RSA 989]|nr:isoamyl acetate-hydrolyzing esterase [Coemansia sp. RSA 1821]KAJ1864558.1 isoamyl acetate-hydrolyzing esterase [Coemansia sp. RSA 989]